MVDVWSDCCHINWIERRIHKIFHYKIHNHRASLVLLCLVRCLYRFVCPLQTILCQGEGPMYRRTGLVEIRSCGTHIGRHYLSVSDPLSEILSKSRSIQGSRQPEYHLRLLAGCHVFEAESLQYANLLRNRIGDDWGILRSLIIPFVSNTSLVNRHLQDHLFF